MRDAPPGLFYEKWLHYNCVMGSFSWQMWPILNQHQADSLIRWAFAAPGFSYGWSWVLLWLEIELMSWLSYQTQPTYFAMRIHPMFSDTLWLIEHFLSAKVGETKKFNHVILNSIFHTCNEKTEHKIVTFVWIWIHNNRVCFKTTRGQTLIKLNLLCMCMYITEQLGSPTRVIYGRNIISVQFT